MTLQRREQDFLFFDQTNGVEIVLVAIHHGGVEIEFMIVENGQIHMGHPGVDGDQDGDFETAEISFLSLDDKSIAGRKTLSTKACRRSKKVLQ